MKYDVAILGAGPGGFRAASLARKAGLSVALIEKEHIGGVCLNEGCIPTKTLVHGAELCASIKGSSAYGITSTLENINIAALIEKKNAIVSQLTKGMETSLKNLKLDYLKGHGMFVSPREIHVNEVTIVCKNVIIATGSMPREIPSIPFNGKDCMSSRDMLCAANIPSRIVIIGGGYIGCEWASLLRGLGRHVEIVEMADTILPFVSASIAKRFQSTLKRRGVVIHPKACVKALERINGELSLAIDGGAAITTDVVLVCVGRIPNTASFGGDVIGLECDRGYVKTNEYLQTNHEHIYAIGDVVQSPQLAHVASYEASVAIKNILDNKKNAVSYDAIPNCIFTNPEIAFIGVTQRSDTVKESRVMVGSNGKAHCESAIEGALSLFYTSDTGKIVGAEMIGKHAVELIGYVSIALRAGLTVYDFEGAIFPHPTFSELIDDAVTQAIQSMQT